MLSTRNSYLPAGIAHLDTGLTDMDRNALTHDDEMWMWRKSYKNKVSYDLGFTLSELGRVK